MTEFEAENFVEEGNEFIVFESRFGLFNSRDREGNGICSSLTKEDCIFWSREHFNGYKNSCSIVTNTKFQGQDMLK
jgi:hypothetical protein